MSEQERPRPEKTDLDVVNQIGRITDKLVDRYKNNEKGIVATNTDGEDKNTFVVNDNDPNKTITHISSDKDKEVQDTSFHRKANYVMPFSKTSTGRLVRGKDSSTKVDVVGETEEQYDDVMVGKLNGNIAKKSDEDEKIKDLGDLDKDQAIKTSATVLGNIRNELAKREVRIKDQENEDKNNLDQELEKVLSSK